MIEFLENIDKMLVLAVNGWHSSFMDEVMWIISGKATWFPLYLFLVICMIRSFGWKKGGVFVLGAVFSIIFADAISVNLFKNVFLRYRPSHNLEIMDQLHFYTLSNGEQYRGGTYGFVSSHAANFAAICGYCFLLFRKFSVYKWLQSTLIIIWLVVIFSRMYLGVHYLSDIFVGSLLGWGVAFVLLKLAFRINQR